MIYDINYDRIFGKGVDGTIYEATVGETNIAVKIMTDDMYDSAIDLKASNSFGPLIYDIVKKDRYIYIIMEKFDGDLTSYINQQLEGIRWSNIIKMIKTIIKPIHDLMIESNITKGDDNTDNYMYKIIDGIIKWVRIDFTQSEYKERGLSAREIKQFKTFTVLNTRRQMETIKLD
jgi:hypothetical protein